ncbi:MAG: DUF4340 domain-containing protein [Gemmatimonadota bacterium]
MKRNHLILVAVLLGVSILLYLPRLLSDDEGQGSIQVDEGFEFSLSDAVTRVDVNMLESGRSLRLERGEQTWTVDGLAVDMSKIETLLVAITDISSSVLVARNPDNHAGLGLSESDGRRIDVYTEAGGPYSFHLGNRDVVGGGYFVRYPGAAEVFRLDGPVGGYLGRDRDGWRSRVIARTDTASVRDLVIRREGDDEIVLRRTDTGWTVDGVVADSTATGGLLGMLSTLSVSGFPTDEEAAAADFSTPDAELDVFAEGGGDVTDRELVLGLRLIQDVEAGDWFVRTVDGDEVYRLAAFSVRRLLPERSALVPE